MALVIDQLTVQEELILIGVFNGARLTEAGKQALEAVPWDKVEVADSTPTELKEVIL